MSLFPPWTRRLAVALSLCTLSSVAAAHAARVQSPKDEALRLFDAYLPKIEHAHPDAVVQPPAAAVGDLDGDGLDDVILSFVFTPKAGGNAIIGMDAAIYLQRDGKMKVAGAFPNVGCGYRIDRIEKGVIKVHFYECQPPYMTRVGEQDFVYKAGRVEPLGPRREVSGLDD